MEQTQGECVEQVIRPTGLLDPVCEIRPTSQVDDLIADVSSGQKNKNAFWLLL